MAELERVEEIREWVYTHLFPNERRVPLELCGIARTALEENTKLKRENEILSLKSRIIDRLPFCPDHRDKVAGKPCRECEVERLQRRLDAATKIIEAYAPNHAWLEDKRDG